MLAKHRKKNLPSMPEHQTKADNLEVAKDVLLSAAK
jgi:hypothetical protein